MKVEGLEHVPKLRPLIFVANFTSSLAAFTLKRIFNQLPVPSLVEEKSTLVVPSRGNRINQLVSQLKGKKFSVSEQLVDNACRTLGKGDSVLLFPEGAPSGAGKLFRGETGVAKVVIATSEPVIPVFLSAEKITFGREIELKRWRCPRKINDSMANRVVADILMYSLMELSNQEYVDVDVSVTELMDQMATKRQRRKQKAARGPGFFRRKVFN